MERPNLTNRLTVWAAVLAVGVVTLTPMILSAQSLAAWARESLGLTGASPWLVPVSLDVAAGACVALALHATLRGDAGGGPKALAWLLVAGSAAANYRHGQGVSRDAAFYFPALPVLAMLLVEIGLRRIRRTALAGLGGLEVPLPRYRFARWLVAPLETWRAWTTAVREGITSPAEALRVARRQLEPEAPAVVPGVDATPAELAADAGELAAMSKADAVRRAFGELGAIDAPGAMRWLAARGVSVSANHAHDVARTERRRQPELRALTGGGGAS